MSNYLDRVWAENGDVSSVPIDAQGDGSVSQEQGWTELYDRDVATDPTALPLSRSNMNGVFNKITSNTKQWLDQCYPDYYQVDNNGNPVEYKIHSAVRYNNGVYLSKVNNNTALPTDATKWSLFQTLDFASEAEAIARTETNKWMNPFVSGKLIDNELVGNTPKSARSLLTTDLNSLSSISDAGFYFQGNDISTPNNHYPVPFAGSLLVSISASQVSQTYTVYGSGGIYSNRIYTRGYFLNVWSGWRDISGGTDTINPVGSIIMFASHSIPVGYLLCNGSSISRIVYPKLFATIGTIYGSGDGSTTFNLPDLRGKFTRGVGGNSLALGVTQLDELKSHRHTSGWYGPRGASGTTNTFASNSSIYSTVYTGYVGGNETRPINIALNYIIKY
tara:strand:- start:15717 stop:16886 length:1170 start_codon:yes stop_codon:yes gene_type:complete